MFAYRIHLCFLSHLQELISINTRVGIVKDHSCKENLSSTLQRLSLHESIVEIPMAIKGYQTSRYIPTIKHSFNLRKEFHTF
jgi:hypothetical protein